VVLDVRQEEDMGHKLLTVTIFSMLLGCLQLVTSSIAQDAPAEVTSWTDGQGLYSYTFAHSNNPGGWLFNTFDPEDPNGCTRIVLRHMAGVTNIVMPEGWAQVTAPDSASDIWWVYTNGTFFLWHTSVVFHVYSAWTNPTAYSPTNSVAAYKINSMVVGCVDVHSSPPGWPGSFIGFQEFSYTGMRFPHIAAIQPLDAGLAVTIGDTCGATCRVETAISLEHSDWNKVTEIPSFSGPTNVVIPSLGGNAGFVRFVSE
jgi:hypothetical protein